MIRVRKTESFWEISAERISTFTDQSVNEGRQGEDWNDIRLNNIPGKAGKQKRPALRQVIGLLLCRPAQALDGSLRHFKASTDWIKYISAGLRLP
jgi:hypothetical protein